MSVWCLDVNLASPRTDFPPVHPHLVSALTQRSYHRGGCPSTGLLVPVLGKGEPHVSRERGQEFLVCSEQMQGLGPGEHVDGEGLPGGWGCLGATPGLSYSGS